MAARRCKAKTKLSKPCPNPAGESGYCFSHDPAKASERTQARRLGGWLRHTRKVADPKVVPAQIRDVAGVLALLDYTLKDTFEQDNSEKRTRALVALAAAYLGALQIGQLEERVRRIEEALSLDKDKL